MVLNYVRIWISSDSANHPRRSAKCYGRIIYTLWFARTEGHLIFKADFAFWEHIVVHCGFSLNGEGAFRRCRNWPGISVGLYRKTHGNPYRILKFVNRVQMRLQQVQDPPYSLYRSMGLLMFSLTHSLLYFEMKSICLRQEEVGLQYI